MTVKSPRTLRRSRRIQAKHNLLMTILGPDENEIAKEIVSTVELSKHGARVRGRKPIEPGSAGVLVELRTLRKAPFRVAWHAKTGEQEYLDSGLEFTEDFDFWGDDFPSARKKAAANGEQEISANELLQEVLKAAGTPSQESERFWEGIWSGLVEQLEERNIFARAELVTYLRKIGQLQGIDSK